MRGVGSRAAGDHSSGAATAVAGPTPGGPTSLERIEWIVSLEGDPVRRNLLITQCYHDLSAALARLLGSENANWCTFATWASRTAGGFIREDEISAAFRLLLGRFAPVHITLARAREELARVGEQASVADESVLDLARDVVHDIARL